MFTNAEIVGRVINGANALQKDVHLSRRYIIAIAKQKAQAYIAQRWADGTLLGDMDLFTRLTCLELERIDRIECKGEQLPMCEVLMRSKEKLPKMVYSRSGAAILSVTSIDDRTLFQPTTLSAMILRRKRAFGYLRRELYYVSDEYLYIPDTEVEAVNVVLLAMDKSEAEGLKGCGRDADCECKSYWDYEFVCPEKLLEYVIGETVNEIAGLRLKVTTDEAADLDSNQRGRKVS
jgi:hypothetical protein